MVGVQESGGGRPRILALNRQSNAAYAEVQGGIVDYPLAAMRDPDLEPPMFVQIS